MLNSEILALLKLAFAEETTNKCLYAKNSIIIKLANGETKKIIIKNSK